MKLSTECMCVELVCAVLSIQHGADVVVVLVRWGRGGSYYPEETALSTARHLASLGVTLVIGDHPLLQQYHAYFEDTLVIFSAGSFFRPSPHPQLCWKQVREYLLSTATVCVHHGAVCLTLYLDLLVLCVQHNYLLVLCSAYAYLLALCAVCSAYGYWCCVQHMHIYWHCVLCVHMATGAASYLYTGAVFSIWLLVLCSIYWHCVLCVQHMATGAVFSICISTGTVCCVFSIWLLVLHHIYNTGAVFSVCISTGTVCCVFSIWLLVLHHIYILVLCSAYAYLLALVCSALYLLVLCVQHFIY